MGLLIPSNILTFNLIPFSPCLATAKNKYRSIEEIKSELEGVNLWMKEDIEIMQEMVDKINKSKSTKGEILEALDQLEYYVHQIDNARDLDSIGGLALVVNFLNQSDEDTKSHAAHVIGSAAQRSLLDDIYIASICLLKIVMSIYVMI